MKRKHQLRLAISLIILFSGMFMAFASEYSATELKVIGEENGVTYYVRGLGGNPIPSGSSITRYFRIGERIGVSVSPWSVNVSSVPVDLLSLDFSITSPEGNVTEFSVWLLGIKTESAYPLLRIDYVEVYNVSGLRHDNSSVYSQANFVGEALSEGRYTLTFTTTATFVPGLPPPLNYMEMKKIILWEGYPYRLLLPWGSAIFVVGAIGGLWTIISSRRRISRRMDRDRGQKANVRRA